MEIEKRFRVDKKVEHIDTAAYHGSGLLEVFATPAMIALMEKSAHLLSRSMLPEDQDTVGVEVNIKHTRATPLGAAVYAEAELVEIDGKRMVFNISAFDEKGEIGKGVHIRYIINPSQFMSRIS